MLVYASAAASPLYRVYQVQFRLSATTLTAVFAVYVLALLVTLLFFGSVSDYMGRLPVIVAAIGFSAAGCAVFLAADTVAALFVARFRQGIATGLASGAIGAALGRLGTREDVMLHQRYVGDIVEKARAALATVDPTPYFMKYGQNVWAAVRAYLDAVTDIAAAPVIEKYTGVLGAADVFTASTTLWVLESVRLDDGVGIPVHP